jgi:catechol 2,3-dioxygenase-like lactoylglutathione lyase family enzyme
MEGGPPRITGIDHVQLAMPSGAENTARSFYAGVLGFEEVEKPPALAGRGGCWFEQGGVALHLGVEESFAPARKAHPAFRVSDLDAAERLLKAAGAPIVPDASCPGVRRIYTADPFGNRIELIEDTGSGVAAIESG